jgi:ubiquitin C-terminal hydrolase
MDSRSPPPRTTAPKAYNANSQIVIHKQKPSDNVTYCGLEFVSEEKVDKTPEEEKGRKRDAISCPDCKRLQQSRKSIAIVSPK